MSWCLTARAPRWFSLKCNLCLGTHPPCRAQAQEVPLGSPQHQHQRAGLFVFFWCCSIRQSHPIMHWTAQQFDYESILVHIRSMISKDIQIF
uniref:Uncharacterized protein n=1 Tax=Triticum urartu TaxID=4572 RepID=A0A8R7PJF1_TRIUA